MILLLNLPPLRADRILALKYGESDYRAALVNSLSKQRTVRLNWLFYLVETGNPPQYTLIDTGFSDDQQRRRFGLRHYRSAKDLLQMAGIQPSQVGRVFLTHSHFDHAGNAPLFPSAQFILTAEEYQHLHDSTIASFLKEKQNKGELLLINESGGLFSPFAARFVGGHTRGSQVIVFTTKTRRYVFTGDECYFADACRAGKTLPAASACAPAKNKQFIGSIHPEEHILTGHETELSGGKWLNPWIYEIIP